MPTGFFGQFFAWLQGVLGTYISQTAAAVAGAIEPAAITLGALYVMAWGWLSLAGRIEEPLLEAVRRVLTLGIVFGLGLKLWAYNGLFVDTFARAPGQLAAAILGVADPVTLVDAIWADGQVVAESLQGSGGIVQSIAATLAALLVYLFVGLLCVYAAFLLALSQIAVAVLLGLGPLFIVLTLFDSTRRFFEAWLAQVSNYALVTVLVALVGGLLLNVVRAYADAAAGRAAGITIAESIRLCVAAVFIFLILRQVLSIAAGLASGVALSSFGFVSRRIAGAAAGGRHRAYQYTRGLLDQDTTRFDSLTRKAGYYTKRALVRPGRVSRPGDWTPSSRSTSRPLSRPGVSP